MPTVGKCDINSDNCWQHGCDSRRSQVRSTVDGRSPTVGLSRGLAVYSAMVDWAWGTVARVPSALADSHQLTDTDILVVLLIVSASFDVVNW